MIRASVILVFGIVPAAFCSADGPTFDVASVKIDDPRTRPPYAVTGGPDTSDPGRFHGLHMSMSALLTRAFGTRNTDQIQGPKWLNDSSGTIYYDINATMQPNTTKEQFQKMVENLLIERFHMVFHHETRGFPGYQLVVDTGGLKINEVTSDPNPSAADAKAVRGERGPDGFPAVSGSRTISQVAANGQHRMKYQERTMAEFISNLGFLIGSSQGRGVLEGFPQPRVVDKTGLTGKYTFILEYYDAGAAARRAPLRSGPAAADGPPLAASEPGGGISILTAIQKQLGLRLDKTADVPLDVIVIVSVDKTPTPD